MLFTDCRYINEQVVFGPCKPASYLLYILPAAKYYNNFQVAVIRVKEEGVEILST